MPPFGGAGVGCKLNSVIRVAWIRGRGGKGLLLAGDSNDG